MNPNIQKSLLNAKDVKNFVFLIQSDILPLYKFLSMNISRISSLLIIILSPIFLSPISSYAACDDPGEHPCDESIPVSTTTSTTPTQNQGSADNILGISTERLRNGDITVSDIPKMIVSIIAFLLGLAGSISVVALIYHAVKMQLASGITGDSS